MRLNTVNTILTLILLMLMHTAVDAQQARGLFFSLYGSDAGQAYGDHNHMQAIYFDIPKDEDRPIYLRIFDADIGGYLDHRVGTSFNTRMRYVVLGGESASKQFGGEPLSRARGVQTAPFANADVIYSRTFGSDQQADGQYVNIGALDPEQGYDTGDGYLRYVLLIMGMDGNDGNYFDLWLSYNPDDKEEPEHFRSFVYDLTLRTPPWEDHQYQVNIPTEGRSEITVGTFGLNNEKLTASLPFQRDIELDSSPAGNWVFNTITIPNPEFTEFVGINIFATESNNTFGLVALDKDNTPIAIPLPVKDYSPVTEPEITYQHQYNPDDRHAVIFQKEITNTDDFSNLKTSWVANQDTLTGNPIEIRFDTLGYHPFELIVSGTIGEFDRHIIFRDSVLVSTPPEAWAGSNRITIPGETIAFDGTVSEPFSGRIISYNWDFGDGNTAFGARVDHTYEAPGMYQVRLEVRENNDTPFNTARDSIWVLVNEPPVPVIDAPLAAQIGEEFILSGADSHSPYSRIEEYIWEIEDSTLYGKTISWTITEERPLDITLTVVDRAETSLSRASTRHSIRVNQPPIANAGSDKHVSPSNPVTYDGSSSYDRDGSIEYYEWIFPGNIIAEGVVVQQAIDEPGLHDVVLRVTDNEGAVGHDTMQVRVNYPPIAVVSGNTVSNSGRISLSGAGSYDPDGEIIHHQWEMGDGRTHYGEDVDHIYRNPGQYRVIYTIVDDSRTLSSVVRDTFFVSINELPVAHIQGPERIPENHEIEFDASQSYDPDGYIEEYLWDFGDGTTASGQFVSHIFEEAGKYQVQLTVRDDSGLEDAVAYAYHEVTVNEPPVLVAEHPNRVVPGESVSVDLSNSYAPNGGSLSYYWKIDGEWTSGSSQREFVFRQGNNNTVQFAVADDTGLEGSRSYGKASFLFNQSPVAIASDDVRSHRRTVVFDGSKSYDPDGDELRYFWDFGDGAHREGPIVVHTYQRGGRYTATLTVDDQQGLDNSYAYDSVNVFINRPPEVFFQIPGTVCVNDTVDFDGSLTYDPDGNETLTYAWDFGDGRVARTENARHSFNEEGQYEITLTVDDNEGMPNSVASSTDLINVVGTPEANAGSNVLACTNEMIQFDGSRSEAADAFLNEYRWDFGDGHSGSGVRPVHRYTEPGEYIVTLTVVGNEIGHCANQSSDQIIVTIEPEPLAEFFTPDEISIYDELVLDASPSLETGAEIQQFTWQIDSLETVTWRREASFDRESQSFQNHWVMNSTLKEGNTREIDRSEYGELPVYTTEMPAGDYTITLSVETNTAADCYLAEQSRSIRVREQSVFSVGDIPLLIPGERFNFKPEGRIGRLRDAVTATWDFGDGNTAEGFEAVHAFEEPGTYEVIMRTDDGRGTRGSVQEIVNEVRVNAPPVPVISGPLRAEPGSRMTFRADDSYVDDGEITEFRWFFSDGYRAEGTEVNRVFDRYGNYSVTLTVVDDAGVANSTQSITRRISIVDRPDLTMRLPTIVCPGVTVDLPNAFSLTEEDSSLADIYIGNSKINFADASDMQFNFPGQYNIRVVMHDGSGDEESSNTYRQSMRVNATPEVYADVPSTVRIGAAGDRATFDASRSFDPDGDLLSFYWDLGDGARKAGRVVTHTYQEEGEYTVTLTVVDDKGLSCSVESKEYTVRVVRD